MKKFTRLVLALAALYPFAAAAQVFTFTHLAGTLGGASYEDGTGDKARFNGPLGTAVDSSGNVYVADTNNHTIRRIAPGGVVSTVAGLAGQPGSSDGIGAAARFNEPSGIVVDAHGVLFVADSSNHTIRRITPDRAVTTFVGLAGVNGAADGTGSAARFQNPLALALDAAGNLYVADTQNQTIRKVTPAGVVTTLAGQPGLTGSLDGTGSAARFQTPSGVASDPGGTLYVADTNNHTLRKITPGGVVTTLAGVPGSFGEADGPGSTARFLYPGRVGIDAAGTVYVADTGNTTIRKVTTDGLVSTLAGFAAHPGTADGTGVFARFAGPNGISTDAAGNLYVADTANHTIRRITPAAVVTTIAGLAPAAGSVDAPGAAALFNAPVGLAVDTAGAVYVADSGNHTIRKVSSSGSVSTFAGSAGLPGAADGSGAAARFRAPLGVAWFGGTVTVADTGNHTIRQISANGAVTTIAGLAANPGSVNGTGSAARFNAPRGVAMDGSGNVYVADSGNQLIRKILPGGIVTTLAGAAGIAGSADGPGGSARFNGPTGLILDATGNLYVSETANSTIRKISPAGVVSTLAGVAGQRGSTDGTGTEARFNLPSGLAIDVNGNLYVADTGNNLIRKVRSAGGNVQTVAGTAGVGGAATDGTGAAARFNGPRGIAVDTQGRYTVADTGNNALRRGVSNLGDKATIDADAAPLGIQRRLDTAPQTASAWEWTIVRRPAGSTAELSSTVVRNPTFTPDVADFYLFRLVASTSNSASITTVGLTICGSTPPVITRTAGSEPSCSGGSVTLDAGEGYISFLWSTGAQTRTITVSPAIATTYTVTAVELSGCTTPAGSYTHQVAPGLSGTTIAIVAGESLASCGSAVGVTAAATDVGGGAVAHQWGFRTTTGGPITPIAGQTSPTYTVRLADFPAPGSYFLVVTSTPSCGLPAVSNELAIVVRAGATSRLVPIVLDVTSGTAHFTTELALTNRGLTDAAVSLTYTAALGASPAGSGTVTETLPAGRQRVIASVIDDLRSRGLPIPPSSAAPQQGGTLLVTFDNVPDASAVAVTARTTSATAAPQPVGAAGLAYSGLGACEGSTGRVHVYGLRSDAADRSNLAIFNTGSDPITVKITLTGVSASGIAGGSITADRGTLSLPPRGWTQLSRVLDGTAIVNGFASVERVSATGSFSAYGVVNDNATNDGSYLGATPDAIASTSVQPPVLVLTVPVVVEIVDPRFSSEIVLANAGAGRAIFTIAYVESLTPGLGAGGSVSIALAPGEQRIIANAVDYLRTNGAHIGAAGAASYAGALRVHVAGEDPAKPLGPVFAGARALARSPAGGQFGLFVPPVYPGEQAQDSAFVYGLRADVDHRSNVAVYNAGAAGEGAITLELRAFDGDAQGAQHGTPENVVLQPGEWKQLGNFLKNAGVANGWVGIRRIAGSAPWSGYGVVNDGGLPGQRTGDGAFVPLTR